MSVKIFDNMIGKIVTTIHGNIGDEVIEFVTTDGSKFIFSHEPDCCESVYIEDICGDLIDLIGSPITMAEEVSNIDEPKLPSDNYAQESYTWTFYKFGTNRGTVTVRWFGESNGCYCEEPQYREFLTQ
jgi:hypothetical protein